MDDKKKLFINVLICMFILTMIFLAYTSKYNINTVSEYVLDKNISKIDKLGNDVETKILENRPFKDIEDIEDINGIGKEKGRIISINFKTSGINVRQSFYFYALLFLIIEGNVLIIIYLNKFIVDIKKQINITLLPLINISNKIKKDNKKSGDKDGK